jgi:hypothetical protein
VVNAADPHGRNLGFLDRNVIIIIIIIIINCATVKLLTNYRVPRIAHQFFLITNSV